MIKTIFFDIGGVLLDIHPDRTLQYLSDSTNIPIEIVESSFPMEAHHRYEKGQITDREFFKLVKAALPQPNSLKEEDFWKAWRMLVGDETEAADILHTLTRRMPVWLLSNTNPYHIALEAHRFSFISKVSGAIYSFAVGSRKPEPDIYHIALTRTKNKPEEVLFIDDILDNVNQARDIGMYSLHYLTAESLRHDMKKLGLFSDSDLPWGITPMNDT